MILLKCITDKVDMKFSHELEKFGTSILNFSLKQFLFEKSVLISGDWHKLLGLPEHWWVSTIFINKTDIFSKKWPFTVQQKR